jgi:hypothetical protein
VKIVHDGVSHLRIGSETTYRNLTMVALLDGQRGEPDYLTLDEALARKCVEVREVSEGGSVNDLRFTNTSNFAVLLLDGEELVGAKQNRVLNLTILAPAIQTIIIPVTCVEQGRWAYRSPGFSSSRQTLHAMGRAQKAEQVAYSRRESGQPRADQAAVWEEVQMKMMRLEAHSPTAAMEDIYEKHETSLGEYEQAFQPVEGQVGALFAINGRIVGLDLFDFVSTLRLFFPKLVRSYALDAIDFQRTSFEPLSSGAVETFLGRVSNAHTASYSGVGEGEDVRLEASGLTGAALVARERVIHLSAFQTGRSFTDEGDDASAGSRLSRSSARRQFLRSPR